MLNKKFFMGFIVGSLIFGSISVNADPKKVQAVKTNITVRISGKEIKPDIYTIDDSAYVNVRGLFEALNTSVEWDHDKQLITIGAVELDSSAADANERAFLANHRIYAAAVSMYMADNKGALPKNNDDISKYIDSANYSGHPEGATYTVNNGVVTSTYPKFRDPDKRTLVFNPNE